MTTHQHLHDVHLSHLGLEFFFSSDIDAMVSIIDSEAHFSKRSEEIGLSVAGQTSLTRAGYTTLGRLAFAVGQPGTPLVEHDFNNFATNILGGMASMHDISSIKRLLFESQTMVISNLREQVTSPDVSASKKMPAVEREAKMRNLRARLPGVLIEKQIEPSHALLNLVPRFGSPGNWFTSKWTSSPAENTRCCIRRQRSSSVWTPTNLWSKRNPRSLINQLQRNSRCWKL